MQDVFIQVGSSRDGRESYLEAAHKRGLKAILVETPQYLALRRAAGRREFDSNIAVTTPSDVEQVWCELVQHNNVVLVLAGFEQYARCAQQIAVRAGLPHAGPGFRSPDKMQQRTALRRHLPTFRQPQFLELNGCEQLPALRKFPFRAVLKPTNGGGGLGVMYVEGPDQLAKAFAAGCNLRNYDGAAMPSWIVEEFVPGSESSVQGICRNGECEILACCDKVIAMEPIAGLDGVHGFREVAHIATPGTQASASTRNFARQAVRCMKYRDGPFHIDFRNGADGPVFLEMGFRLSGAAVTDLVQRVSGVDWGDVTFAWMLEGSSPPPTTGRVAAAAQVLVFGEDQVVAAGCPEAGLRVWTERMGSPALKLAPHYRCRLGADMNRHAGPIARMVIAGDTRKLVQDPVETICNRTLPEGKSYEHALA